MNIIDFGYIKKNIPFFFCFQILKVQSKSTLLLKEASSALSQYEVKNLFIVRNLYPKTFHFRSFPDKTNPELN